MVVSVFLDHVDFLLTREDDLNVNVITCIPIPDIGVKVDGLGFVTDVSTDLLEDISSVVPSLCLLITKQDDTICRCIK